MKNKLFAVVCALSLFGCVVEAPPTVDPNTDVPDEGSDWVYDSESGGGGGSICSLYNNFGYYDSGLIKLPPFCNPFYFETGRPPTVEDQNDFENSINPGDLVEKPEIISEKVSSDNFS